MSNLIVRYENQELLFKGPQEAFELTKILGRFDRLEVIKRTFEPISKLNKTQKYTYVVEFLTDCVTLTVFRKIKSTPTDTCNWVRLYYLIWKTK